MAKKNKEKTMTESQKLIMGTLKQRNPQLQVRWDHELNAPALISGKLAEPFAGKSERMIVEAALEFLDENKSLLKMKSPKQELQLINKVTDANGNTCVAMQQTHKGLPVDGGTVRVQFDGERSITHITNKYQPDLDIDTKAKIDVKNAVKTALKDAKTGKPEEGYTPTLSVHQYKGKNYLAYQVHIDDVEHERELHYYVDAHDGSIIHKYNSLRNMGHGSGVYSGSNSLNSILDGSVYKLIDSSRTSSGGPEIRTCDLNGTNSNCSNSNISQDSDDTWNDGTTSPRKNNQGAEVDIHRYLGEIVNYYRTIHSWNSFDGAGATIYAGAHLGSNYNNAYYSPGQKKFYFGDGDNSLFSYLTAKDVIAHEFTHAVTDHTSNLGYPDDQPGALNEAFSDIFAAFIDNDETDMGAECTTPAIAGDCLRRMNNPSDPALGADFRIPNHVVAAFDSMGIGYQNTAYDADGYIIAGDPHVNCGPVIYAAYFMLLGGTHPNSGISVIGIGYTKTAQIFWHIQSIGLLGNSNATFLECREAALNAVNSLFKAEADYLRIMDSVKNAFTAVGIGPDIFVRDSLSDIGTIPSIGTLCMSPDIITRTAQVVNPSVTLGDMTNANLAEDVESGQTNYVYVRLQNRGAVPGDVEVKAYWCDPSTFANPSVWHLVGTKMVYNVQPGTVSIAEIPWPSADLPPLGHFCMVSELNDPIDPAPDKTIITSGALYTKFISESNNYAWKNINVVDVLPAGLTGMDFFIAGKAQESSELKFELDQLPSATEVHVKILRRLSEGAQLIGMQFEKMNTRYCYYKMNAGKVCSLRDIPFQNNDESLVSVYLKLPEKSNKSYEVAVTQYVNGSVTGRVTRIFNVVQPGEFDFIGNSNSTEVHKKGCKWISKMAKSNMVGFRTLDFAHSSGYDNCAFCLGQSTR
jgi:bacillolysin